VPSSPVTATAGTGVGRPHAGDVDRHVGARVRERRLALGLTQQQVAELVGVTYQQAHKYEKAVNRISAGRLHLIARALGVAPAYFFEGLDRGAPAGPTVQQRQLLELSRTFAALSRRHQEAVAGLARALVGAPAGPDDGEGMAGEREGRLPSLP
jgi:transcriptional regulator with XRE-family HTH domain